VEQKEDRINNEMMPKKLFRDIQFEDSVLSKILGFCHSVNEICTLFGILTTEDVTNRLS
jgi:hypothetical protein